MEFSSESIGKIYFWTFCIPIIVIVCFVVGRRDIFSSDPVSHSTPPSRKGAGLRDFLGETGCPQSASCGFVMILRASCGQPLEGRT
jgi:hypothetical protein